MGMRKIRKPTSSTKNAPARQLRSSVTAFVSSNPLEESPNPLKISREQSNRLRNPQKREYPAGDEYSPELRKDLPSALVRIPASQDSVDVESYEFDTRNVQTVFLDCVIYRVLSSKYPSDNQHAPM